MNQPKPFPILRLPYLAIEEVFKAMHPIEIINFSMISKRAKSTTNQMTFYSKYSIEFCVDEELRIEINGTDELVTCIYLMTSDEKMDGKTEEDGGHGYIQRTVFKYSKDPVDEWKQLCKYVLEIFKRQTIDLLRMTIGAFVGQNVSIIDFLKSNLISVDGCYLDRMREEKNVDEHTAYLLNNITINAKLFFHVNIKNENFDGKIPKNLQHLMISHSEWIGYEKLLEIDSKYVILRNNRITNGEWNSFFKKWIAMETHLNLKCLKLKFKSLEEFKELVLYDIPHEVVDEGVKRVLNM
ncbi:hypothetical protein CRE_01496 [Caenorhabditis remanei]|uniref:F-box domain-containing protein n=1 Tax=Caenorhabditis remanei TaxID=31234 RepID=E3NSZ0_CAERE|nr:hypothetical protein CRE_01496 [Caenorhabditis remanei]